MMPTMLKYLILEIIIYKGFRKLTTAQGEYYTTGSLLDYNYIKIIGD